MSFSGGINNTIKYIIILYIMREEELFKNTGCE